MAALYGLRLLCDSVKNSRILLQLDNTCAVADINKMGSTQSSDIMLYTRYSAVVDDHVVHEIQYWIISSNNWLSATHIPGVPNMEAGKKSRHQELRTEWILNRQDFEFIVEKLRFVSTVDLFASSIKIQLEEFISNRLDPKCIAMDSYTQS